MFTRFSMLAASAFAWAVCVAPAAAQTISNADQQVSNPNIIYKDYGDHPQIPLYNARPDKPEEVVPGVPHTPDRQFHPTNSGMPYTQAYMNRALEVTPSGGYPGTNYYGFWTPGGYQPRVGSPYYYNSGLGVAGVNTQTAGGDPYGYHFGPGFYRNQELGHYRFPFYSYRRPWYHPGFANYNRDTNFHW